MRGKIAVCIESAVLETEYDGQPVTSYMFRMYMDPIQVVGQDIAEFITIKADEHAA